MKVEIKSYAVIFVAFLAGILLGVMWQQRTDEHKLIMAEWKKIQGINSLVDMKLQNEVIEYTKKRSK